MSATSRDTVGAIGAAGFELEPLRRMTVRPCVLMAPVAPHIIGAARKP